MSPGEEAPRDGYRESRFLEFHGEYVADSYPRYRKTGPTPVMRPATRPFPER